MSRRQNRRSRREAKRMMNRHLRNAGVGTIDDVFTFDTMFRLGKKCCTGVRWKQSTQNFERHLFSETAKNLLEIKSGRWMPHKCKHFTIVERGKVRPIDSPPIRDRQIHKTFSRYVLNPLYVPYMVEENGASLPDKGFHYAMEQMKDKLREHFRKYGMNGHIIQIDFKQFFPSVPHYQVKQHHLEYIYDPELRRIADVITDTITDDVGLPLGVEPSQLEMVFFPTKIDTYLKCQMHLDSIHYMDDYTIFVPPEMDPKGVLDKFRELAHSIGLKLNEAKTQIIKFGRPFRWCKTRYSILPSGKVVTSCNPRSQQAARRKISKFKELIDAGKASYEDLYVLMNCLLAYLDHYNDDKKSLRLRQKFYSIYHFEPTKIEEYRLRDARRIA